MRSDKVTTRLTGILRMLLFVHFLGASVAFSVFSWQYANQHGVVSWILLGQVYPGMKAMVWEYFLVTHLSQETPPIGSPPDEHTVDPVAMAMLTSWDRIGFERLLSVLSGEGVLRTSYRTGDGSQVVNIVCSADSTGVSLELDLPQQVIRGGKLRVPIMIRDHDRDGALDDWRILLKDTFPLEGEQITDDGFVVYRPSEEHRLIRMQWMLGIGFLIEKFAPNEPNRGRASP